MRTAAILLACVLAAAASPAAGWTPPGGAPPPTNLARYYTGYPQPASLLEYTAGVFKCASKYALCSYAVCVPVPNSKPPVAECGCYSFDGVNLGDSLAILNQEAKVWTTLQCAGQGRGYQCTTTRFNASSICNRMAGPRFLYPGYDFVSTYNSTAWAQTTGQANPQPTVCRGGTFANCFTAACRAGTPESPTLLNLYSQTPGVQAPNATCYCPLYTYPTSRVFSMAGNYPCGTLNAATITPTTLIYNGA